MVRFARRWPRNRVHISRGTMHLPSATMRSMTRGSSLASLAYNHGNWAVSGSVRHSKAITNHKSLQYLTVQWCLKWTADAWAGIPISWAGMITLFSIGPRKLASRPDAQSRDMPTNETTAWNSAMLACWTWPYSSVTLCLLPCQGSDKYRWRWTPLERQWKAAAEAADEIFKYLKLSATISADSQFIQR